MPVPGPNPQNAIQNPPWAGYCEDVAMKDLTIFVSLRSWALKVISKQETLACDEPGEAGGHGGLTFTSCVRGESSRFLRASLGGWRGFHQDPDSRLRRKGPPPLSHHLTLHLDSVISKVCRLEFILASLEKGKSSP